MEIIAEIGQNHNGNLRTAKKLIEKAKNSGADVVKFQIYDAKKLFSKINNPWYDYNCKTELSFEKVKILHEECKKLKIEFMASVFDAERVDWLEKLGVKRYKIASRSIFDKNLINKIIETNKPIIVSLGFWKKESFPKSFCNSRVSFLYCISNYPTNLEQIKLSNVCFKKFSGFSDHTIGINASKIAMSRGARIIEKHFTLSHKTYGPDHACSMVPTQLEELVKFKNDLKKCI